MRCSETPHHFRGGSSIPFQTYLLPLCLLQGLSRKKSTILIRSKISFYFFFGIWLLWVVPCKFFRFCIKINCLVDVSIFFYSIVSTVISPNNSELKFYPKNFVQYCFKKLDTLRSQCRYKTPSFANNACANFNLS